MTSKKQNAKATPPPEEDKPKAAPAKPKQYAMAKGRSVTSGGKIITGAVTPNDLAGGQKAFDAFIRDGFIVEAV